MPEVFQHIDLKIGLVPSDAVSIARTPRMCGDQLIAHHQRSLDHHDGIPGRAIHTDVDQGHPMLWVVIDPSREHR